MDGMCPVTHTPAHDVLCDGFPQEVNTQAVDVILLTGLHVPAILITGARAPQPFGPATGLYSVELGFTASLL